MQDRLTSLIESARKEISRTSDPARVEELRIRYLGKKKKQKVGRRGTSHLTPEDAKKIKECFPYAR